MPLKLLGIVFFSKNHALILSPWYISWSAINVIIEIVSFSKINRDFYFWISFVDKFLISGGGGGGDKWPGISDALLVNPAITLLSSRFSRKGRFWSDLLKVIIKLSWNYHNLLFNCWASTIYLIFQTFSLLFSKFIQ